MKESQATPVAVIAIVPPPHNGMSAVTSIVIRELERHVPVLLFPIQQLPGQTGFPWLIRKQLKSFSSLAAIIRWRKAPVPPGTLYLVANSGHGLWATIAQAWLARRLGMRVVLHHHVYSYLSRRDARMALLCRTMTGADAHIALCKGMADTLIRHYSPRGPVHVLPNPILDEPGLGVSRKRQGPQVFGHLSNLSFEKGLDVVIRAFEVISKADPTCRLVLAGPAHGSAEVQLIEQAVARNAGRISYLGPLHGDSKRNFFEEIDVFLFPTRYRNEAFPLVIEEAILSSIPVIAYDRGCIRSLVGDAGVVVDNEADYVAAVQLTVSSWQDPDEWARMGELVARRRESLARELNDASSRIVSLVVGSS